MRYKHVLVTGGAGFVGSHISFALKDRYADIRVTVLDNLIRKGSEMNVPRLKDYGIEFLQGDVRFKKDLDIHGIDLIIECSAEPSVMAGVTSSPEYLIDTNLIGAINCFELARKNSSDILFLSTSRVYPVKLLNDLFYLETETRFMLQPNQKTVGSSEKGISEEFPLFGARTLYGSTKLSSEIIMQEYLENYHLRGVIDRCGLITGPWQMGKVDQGVIVFWLARHIYNKPISYIGFEGSGKQVRDVIAIDDLIDLLFIQLEHIEKYSGGIYNVGGGVQNSVSLIELTKLCQAVTGQRVEVTKDVRTRKGDVRIYISDCEKIMSKAHWYPKKSIQESLEEIYRWIKENKETLKHVLS